MTTTEFQNALNQIADDYRAATYYETLEKTAKDSIYKEHGIDGLKDERLISDSIKTLEMNHTIAARDQIKALQDSYRKDHEALVNKHQRAIVRTHSGITVAEDYAKKNGISLEAALTELNAYARTKTTNFTDTPADRYSAIVNAAITDRPDQAHSALATEKKLAGVYQFDEAIKTGSYLLNEDAPSLLKKLNTSGYQLSRQMENQAK